MAGNAVVPAVPPMTEKDIKKLEEVTKNRFKLLALQLKNRKKDLLNAAEQQLDALYEEELAKAKEVQDKLEAEYQELEQKSRELEDKGIDFARDLEKAGIVVAARNNSGRRSGQYYNSHNPFIYRQQQAVNDYDWIPKGYKEKLKAATAEIDKLIRNAEEQLEMKKLEIMEKLAVGVLQTEDAKKYVEQIPEIMDLVPDNAFPQLTK